MEVEIILEPDLTPEQIAEIAVAAEGYGIRGLWASNYHAHWDPFLSLIPAAQATNRILLGPLALSPFEMHPLKIAIAMLTFNKMCGGRGFTSIGAGEGVTEAGRMPKHKRLVAAVRESLEIVIKAANEGLVDGYDGEIFQVKYAMPTDWSWAEAEGPKVFAASIGPQMLRMGARVADGIGLSDMQLEMLPEVMREIDAGLSRRAEPPVDFRLGNFYAWHIKENREASLREASREIAWRCRWLSSEFISHYLDADEVEIVRQNFDAFVTAWFDRSGKVAGVPDKIVDTLTNRLTATGDLSDIDRIVDRFREMEKFGVTEICLRLHDDPMDAVKLIGEHIVSAVR